MKRAVLSWSGGKDCAWVWRGLRGSAIEIVSLITTYNETNGTIPIHNVGIESIAAQAEAMGLSLCAVPLPDSCPNEIYRERLQSAFPSDDAIIFGDLFLKEIREFREKCWPERELLFPLWQRDTSELAQEMVRAGLRAHVTAVDTAILDSSFVGKLFDKGFLDSLPPSVDPCGENGEFHTYVEPAWLSEHR